MKIEIMGPGCPRCGAVERNAIAALNQLGVNADLEHVYDVKEYIKRGVMFTPALAVDGEVKVAGRVPSVEELKALFASLRSSS